MFCRHKFGSIKDNYQYCEKCGKAIPVECAHKWKILHEYPIILFGSHKGVLYISQCINCGKIITTESSVYQ